MGEEKKRLKRPPRSRKCSSFDEVVNVQRIAIKKSIQEAQEQEKIRRSMLRDAPSAERIEELKVRHTKERLRDQEKITRLIDDLNNLKEVGESKTVGQQYGPPKIKTMNADRFEFARLHDCYKDRYDKFDAIDSRANQVCKERFDEYKERKTLKLLQSKRDCLTKLVSIQRQAIYGHDASGPRTGRSSSSRHSDTSSVASYATFNPPASDTKEKIQRQKIGKSVPKLF